MPNPNEKVSEKILKRAYLLFGGFIVLSVAILAKIIYLQVFESEKWLAEAAASRLYYKAVHADRGAILADDGSILAVTIPSYRVAIDATAIQEHEFANFSDSLDLLCRRLEERFKQDSLTWRDYKKIILTAKKTKDRHCYLWPYKRQLKFDEMKYVSTLPIFNRGSYKGGLIIEKVNDRRFYPLGQLGLSTLGHLDSAGQGKRGIEYTFNAALKGTNGEVLVQRVSPKLEVPLNYIHEVEAKDGYDVVTTLNVHMQDVVSTALSKAIKQHQATGGVAILMETKTGHIKALANFPEVYNQAVATQEEPGSTFKIATLIAALEDGIVTPDDTLDGGKGERMFYDRKMTDVKVLGKLTVKEAFEKSSNVAIAELINRKYQSNPRRFIELLEKTGVLDFSGFQLRGEPAPYIIKPDNPLWNGTTLPWLSIGYNIKLTPLQMLTFVNAVANDGQMIQPLIATQIRNNAGIREEFKTKVLREQICSPKTLQLVREMMEGVVENGTANNIKGSSYKIAGKTGTAMILEDGIYREKYRASFAGYFPAHNPTYSCIVVINAPKSGSIYGSQVAAPIFKEIADNIFSTILEENYREPIAVAKPSFPISPLMNVNDAKVLFSALNVSAPDMPSSEFARVKSKGNFVEMKPMVINRRLVPNVIGMSGRDAVALLENLGLVVEIQGHGRVKYQSLIPETRIQKGQKIILSLSHS